MLEVRDVVALLSSNTLASLATGGQRLGTWFDRRARKLSMKCSKSITLGKTAPITCNVTLGYYGATMLVSDITDTH